MAQTPNADLWSLPNYAGELFTADMINTPLLSIMGGLTGGGLQTTNFEFPVTSEYDFPGPAQPAISETQSMEAEDPTHAVREQEKNVTQIFRQAVKLSYVKLSNRGKMSGINTAGASNNVEDELAFQINYNLQIIARNVEHTIINGAYQTTTAVGSAARTRGLLAAVNGATLAGDGGVRVDADGGALTRAMLQELWREMFSKGAPFTNPAIIVNGYQKQAISDIYGYAPESRNVGGLNIQQIETDFGNIGVLPAHRFMPTTSLLVVELSMLSPVFQPVPNKGNFFYEEKQQAGAAVGGEIFGQFGLDHGPSFMMGEIYGLADGS